MELDRGFGSSLPPAACPHLELLLDSGNEGVEKDLYEIADLMLDWEEKLSAPLGLTPVDISDIKETHFRKPVLQRCLILECIKHEVSLCVVLLPTYSALGMSV